MKTRAFCYNGKFLRGSYAGIFANARFVFVNGSTPGSGERGPLSIDNLADQLAALEESGKLNKAAVTKALNVLQNGDEAAKEKVLQLTEKVISGAYNSKDFASRLPRVKTAEEAAEKPAAAGEAPSANVIKLSDFIREKVKKVTDIMEKAELKEKVQSMDNAEATAKLEKLTKSVKALNELDKKNNDEMDGEIKSLLDGVKSKIDKDEYNKILTLDALDPEYEKQKKEIEEKPGHQDETVKHALETIFQKKVEQAEKNKKIEEDLRKVMHELREVMNYMGDVVRNEQAKKKAIDNLTRTTGINIQPGQKLSYLGLKLSKEGRLVPTKDIATIKRVEFLEEAAPVIIVETKDAKTGEPVEDIYNTVDFIRFVDAVGATEDINNLAELEGSIGTKIKPGDKFEFSVTTDATSSIKTEDHQVGIEKIDEGEKMITLTQDVRLAPQATPSRYLTYGEFAKWCKRAEAEKVISSVEELRGKLLEFNAAQNAAYNRDASKYPPIEGKVGEILKYDDGTDRTWVIKEIDDNHVKFDSGDEYTLTGFYRWVKKNEVEKFDPKAEAALRTEGEDEEARKRMEEEMEKVAAARLAEAEKDAGHSDAHHDSHHESLPTINSWKKLWAQTRFLSAHGLMEMGKTIIELIKRKLKRSEHDRVGTVGQQMFSSWWPELGAEFKGVAQHAENEEVKHHADHYRTMGIETVKHELHEAPTKDILKAAVQVLTEKGQMRWDDPGFWAAMNKYAYGELTDDKERPGEPAGGPLWVRSDNYMDAIEKYMDKWWGQDTFREFRNKQDSSYNSIRSSFTDHATRLENDPDKNGGLRFQLKKMLWQHLHGEHVNAAQFESYLHFAIKAGKLGFADKVFFLMMGVGQPAKGQHGHAGETLLHLDRVSAIEGELMNNFPILDYFTDPDTILVDENGNPKLKADGTFEKGRPDINNFKNWIKTVIQPDLGGDPLSVSDPNKLGPGHSLQTFIDKTAVWNEWVNTRLLKSAKAAGNWDHDDMHVNAAFVTESLVDQMVIKQGGATQQVSTPGLKNAMAGFNDFIKIKIDMASEHSKEGNNEEVQKDMRHLTNLIKSFTKLDAILDERFEMTGSYTRFAQQDWDSAAGAEDHPGRTVRLMADEVRNYVAKLSQVLDAKTGGKYQLTESWKTVQQRKHPDTRKQTQTSKNFGELLDGALAEVQEKGGNVSDVFQQAQYSGGKTMVKGIIAKAIDKKTSGEVASANIYEFRPYVDQVMVSKIEEIKELKRKIAETPVRTPEQIKDIEDYRAKKILNDYDSGNYAAQPDDAKILDKEIERLRDDLQRKKTGRAPEEGQRGGPKKKAA